MRYAYFPGCKIGYHLPAYGRAVEALCAHLDIGLAAPEFGCCGYPVRHQSFEASMFSAARNLALAARAGLPVMTPCKCCFGNLRHAAYWLEENRALAGRVDVLLAEEGLPGVAEALSTRVVHLLTVLDADLGNEAITAAIKRPLSGLRVAAHYGCHALRPSNVTRFANPLAPRIFERLIQATGAVSVAWAMRLECCGNPLWGKDDTMAARLARRKLHDAGDAGARVVATACTYCQLQFDTYRDRLAGLRADAPVSVLYAQLLGLALDIPAAELGMAAAEAEAVWRATGG